MEQLCELEQFIFTGHFCFTSCSFLTPRRSLNNAARQGVVPRQCQWNCGRRGVIGGSRTDWSTGQIEVETAAQQDSGTDFGR
jgi:hypothetical protein